jgi:LuxR family maltose regulon positive regulatory protein
LFAQLNTGLSAKLTLVSAPAGFGKTTLVSAWARNFGFTILDFGLNQPKPDPKSKIQNPKCSWVSLDDGDNDPTRFWRYVITACQVFGENIGQSALALLRAAQQPAWETVLTLLINDLAQLSGTGILVLEDYHVISALQIHEQLAFLLDYLPPTLHLVITTRSAPPLPLARLRAQSALNELGAADLRFSSEEIGAFCRQMIGRPLTPDVIARLEARTEGWVTGLHLVALTLQGQAVADPQAIKRMLDTFTGSHQHVFAYFITETLNAQPAHLKQFLLLTSVLDRMCGPLCDAVLGIGDQGSGIRAMELTPDPRPLTPDSYSRHILDQLARANLFLVPLDESGQWYRYHALFAEAMRHEAQRRLGEAQLRTLSLRASHWYEQHGFLSEAIESALAAHDFIRAAILIERSIAPELTQNEHHTLRRWIERLPKATLNAHPSLCLACAIATLFTSDRRAPTTKARIDPLLSVAEQHWRAENNTRKLGELLAFRALATWWQTDFAQAFASAKQALELLPEDAIEWRGISLLFVGFAQHFDGQIKTAQQTLLEARNCCTVVSNTHGIRGATLLLAEGYTLQGALHQADQLYRRVIDLTGATGDAQYNYGQALAGLSALAYERNDLATAEGYATQALDYGDLIHAEDVIVRATLLQARILQAHQEIEQARRLLHTLLAQTKRPALVREIQAGQARLALVIGDIAAVQRWVDACAQADSAATRLQQEQEALLVVRLQIAQGKPDEALQLLETWHREAREQGRARSELEMIVLQSLAHAAAHDLPQAKATLLQALTSARAEGYQRLFLDEGTAMLALLHESQPDVNTEPLATYVQELLLAFAQEQPDSAPMPASPHTFPIEPLSPYERRVLSLLADGLSNTEIARQQVVSINTVKTQVKSIYRKLDVTNRIEACNTARRLGLI